MVRKWEQAIYTDADGLVRSVQPEELHDAKFRAFLKTQELWDTQGEYRLHIRHRANSFHFYSLAKRVRTFVKREETSKRHSERIDELLSAFQANPFLFGHLRFDDEERQFVSLFQSKDYQWEQEVTRSAGEIRWRHDLFAGHSAHRLSDRAPWVAIEVIDSHFPADLAFDAWLKQSEEIPSFVLFDFVQIRNYFFQVDKADRWVRVIYYIFDGKVWCSGEPIADCTATLFKEKVSEHIRRKLPPSQKVDTP